METNAKKVELESLQNRLAENPTNAEILTELAFYYLKNPDGHKELEYFEQAYLVNPTLENTHNYAFWLAHDYGDWEKASPLQQQVLAMHPHSCYPYLAYAQSLIDSNSDMPYAINTLNKLIELYQMAIHKIKNSSSHSAQLFTILKITHNLAICHIFLGDNQQAEQYFNQALTLANLALNAAKDVAEEAKYRIMLDFSLFYLINQQPDNALHWLQKASLSTQKDNLDIADLYGRLGDFQQAYNFMKDDFKSYGGYEWAFLALHKLNPSQWRAYYLEHLENAQERLGYQREEFDKAMQQQDDKAIKENQAYITVSLEDIADLENLLTTNQPVTPKKLPLHEEFHFNHFGCLLFGCQSCGNLTTDHFQN